MYLQYGILKVGANKTPMAAQQQPGAPSSYVASPTSTAAAAAQPLIPLSVLPQHLLAPSIYAQYYGGYVPPIPNPSMLSDGSLCHEYLTTGVCSRGDRCRYKHVPRGYPENPESSNSKGSGDDKSDSKKHSLDSSDASDEQLKRAKPTEPEEDDAPPSIEELRRLREENAALKSQNALLLQDNRDLRATILQLTQVTPLGYTY